MAVIVLNGVDGVVDNTDFIGPQAKEDLVHQVTTANTSYQNTESYPIWFHAKLGSNASYQVQVSADNSTWKEITKSDGGAFNFMCLHVPPGWYFRCTGGVWGGYGTSKGANGDVKTQ